MLTKPGKYMNDLNVLAHNSREMRGAIEHKHLKKHPFQIYSSILKHTITIRIILTAEQQYQFNEVDASICEIVPKR